jgi:hypothetical protein
MTDYSLHTSKSWLQTRSEIANEFRLWGIEDWIVEQFNNGAKLSYVRNGKTIDLFMDKQERPADNLRVLYFTIHSLRMNEVRGISEVMATAYLQIAGPKQKRNPYDVLMIMEDSPLEVAEAVFRSLAKKHHPDNGGNVETFKELNEAIEEIRASKK